MQKIIFIIVCLLVFSNSLVFGEMLFNDIKEEIKSPYSSGISPYYNSNVNDAYSPRSQPILSEDKSTEKEDPNQKTSSIISDLEEESQKILKPNQTRVIANFQKNVDDTKKEKVIGETLSNETPEKISPNISTNKNEFIAKESTSLKVEIRPSSDLRYPPTINETITNETTISDKDKYNTQLSLLKPENTTNINEVEKNLSQKIVSEKASPKEKESWFILIQASPTKQNLVETQEKIKSFLSQKVPLNIHIDDSYNLLLAGPVDQSNVGMLLKLIQFNGYPRATAILNK